MMRAIILVLVVAVSVPVAHAQTPSPSDADRAAALAMMQAGISSAEDGDWEAARIAFTRAYTLVASTRVLMNLAGAQRHTGRLRDARESYRRWLIDATDRDEAYRSTVEQALADLANEIPTATVSLRGSRDGDVVQIDGGDVEVGASVELDPGTHTAEIVRGSTVLTTQTFTVAIGDHPDLELAVPSLEPEAVASTAPPPRSMITEHEHEDITQSPWFWVGVGGGAAVVIGVIIGIAVAASSSGTPAPDMGTLGPFRL